MKFRRLALSAALLCSTMYMPPSYAADDNLKIVNDPLELTIHFHFRDKYVYSEDWPVEKQVAELTGIHVKNVASLAIKSSRDAFNLLMASGDLPDIIGGDATGGLKDDFIRYGMEGAFVPLDDLIAEHAPHLKKFFDEHPAVRQAITAADGHIYFIPYVPEGDFARGWFIRQDWLDKLGLKTPETVDELHDVLVAFRDKDPNGNGQKDEVPYFGREPAEAVRLINMWDARVTGSDRYGDFMVEDKKVLHPWTTEAYKTAMGHLAQWFKEGLIDKEVFTRGARVREYMLGNNLGGMTHDWFASTAGYNETVKDKVAGINFKPMLPPKTVSGQRFEDNRRATVQPSGWAISHTNKHPVETIKYFDFWFTEKGRLLSNWGIEGETYDMVDGKPVYKESVLKKPKPVNAQLYDYGAQIPRGYWQSYDYEIPWTNKIALDGIAMYKEANLLQPEFTGVSMNPEERAIFDKYWSSLFTYMTEMQQTWVLGAKDINADWADYQARLKQLGFEEVMTVMQTAYDRQYAAK